MALRGFEDPGRLAQRTECCERGQYRGAVWLPERAAYSQP
jgi:hypothetical protein